MSWARRLQCAAVCALIATYAGLSHYSNATSSHTLGATLAFVPLTLFTTFVVWRETPRWLAALLSAGLAAVVYGLWPLLERHYSLLYLIQESCAYTVLGLTFGRTLLPNRVALCTTLADKVHGPLSPRELRYTRLVTAAWSLFFFAVTAGSLLLYTLAPLRIWSIYINFCAMPLVGTMFVAENLVRRLVLPQVKRTGLLATVRVYFATPQKS
jgi:uncharacterized membrane protein